VHSINDYSPSPLYLVRTWLPQLITESTEPLPVLLWGKKFEFNNISQTPRCSYIEDIRRCHSGMYELPVLTLVRAFIL